MSQQGILSESGSGDPHIETLTGDTGGAVGPDGAFNINIVGGDTTEVDGNSGTNTLTINTSSNGYPITPFVVGNAGGYATIQSALDAANAEGAYIVFVQSGTYSENLTLYPTSIIWGESPESVTISGEHTLPASGFVYIRDVSMVSSGDTFTGGGVIDQLFFDNVEFNLTSAGYIVSYGTDTDEGTLTFLNCRDISTDNGIVSFSNFVENFFTNVFYSTLGGTTGNGWTSDDLKNIQHSTINCPITFQQGLA